MHPILLKTVTLEHTGGGGTGEEGRGRGGTGGGGGARAGVDKDDRAAIDAATPEVLERDWGWDGTKQPSCRAALDMLL